MSQEPKGPRAYDIGYGKPPKATQFQPGKSGNPRGRPKGQPRLQDLVLREAARLMRVKIGDSVEHVSKADAVVRKLFAEALSGKLGALNLMMSVYAHAESAAEVTDHTGSASVPGVDPDEETLQRMLARFADQARGGGK